MSANDATCARLTQDACNRSYVVMLPAWKILRSVQAATNRTLGRVLNALTATGASWKLVQA